MDHDPYEGIFDALRPEDFLGGSSAIHETTPEHLVGDLDFLVGEYLHILTTAFAASPVARSTCILASPTVKRVFEPEQGEKFGDFLTRIGNEARVISAEFIFIFTQTQVAALPGDGDTAAEISNVDQHLQKVVHHLMVDAIYWYSELVDPDGRHCRHGFLPIQEDGTLGASVEGYAEQPNLFKTILDFRE